MAFGHRPGPGKDPASLLFRQDKALPATLDPFACVHRRVQRALIKHPIFKVGEEAALEVEAGHPAIPDRKRRSRIEDQGIGSPCHRGPCYPRRMGQAAVRTALAELEERYGRMESLGTGLEARVFRSACWVYKVYRPKERDLAFREARNLARAGFGERVREVTVLESGHGVLVLRYFPGKPLAPDRFDGRALASLSALVLRLHRLPEPGRVNGEALSHRLSTFQEALAHLPGVTAVARRLRERLHLVAGTPLRFGHADLWAGNVLVAEDGQVFVVDWARAGPIDPARDLAILKTGSLDLLGPEAALYALRRIVRRYPDPEGVWQRLAFWIPLTYLHDLYWFLTKAPEGLAQAVREKLPLARRLAERFPPL